MLERTKVSRSKIDLFLECPRCFYMDVVNGLRRPDSYPLTLNIAVDHLLKKEFDIHRADGSAHPMMETYKIDAVPYNGNNFGSWREVNFGRGGIHHIHKETTLEVYGAVDDIWVKKNGELIVVDYKATAKKDTPTLEGNLGAQYKRQMEVYQWLLEKNDFKVAKTGYFVYVNGKKDAKAFDAKLEFDVSVISCEGDNSWVDGTLRVIRSCIDGDLPEPSEGCKFCSYRKKAAEISSTSKKSKKG